VKSALKAKVLDHGYPVQEGKRCSATTKKALQCQMTPLVGIELCALHAGLARSRGSRGYGDPKALETFIRMHKAAR
jgi:hypothetical protein